MKATIQIPKGFRRIHVEDVRPGDYALAIPDDTHLLPHFRELQWVLLKSRDDYWVFRRNSQRIIIRPIKAP